MIDPLSESLDRLDSRLAALRADETRRRVAFTTAVSSGFVLAWLHWTGLVVAGALIGLTRRRGRWAVVSGLGFGTLMVLVTVLVSPMGAGEFAALTPVNYLTGAAGLLLPAWGALVRYVI